MGVELDPNGWKSSTIKTVSTVFIGISIAFLVFNIYFYHIAYSTYRYMKKDN